MPSAVEFQRLADELRQVENAIIQAASDGDQELVLLAVGHFHRQPVVPPGGQEKHPKLKRHP